MSSLTASRSVVVTNQAGLHARAALAIAKMVRQFQSKVELVKEHQRVEGKDVMQILTLGALPGTKLLLEADGPDAEQAVDALAQLFFAKFHEEPEK
jgi:phosphocarrier protein HPr